MKKIISTVLVCVLLLGCVMSLISCGKMLSGKYECIITESNRVTYEFTPSKVTKTTTLGALGYTKDTVVDGTYKINEVDEDRFEITFTWDVEGDEDEISTVSFSQGEENGEKYIKLDGVKFKKVD